MSKMEGEVPLVDFSCVLPNCTSFYPQSKPSLQKSSDAHDISYVLSPTCTMEMGLSSSLKGATLGLHRLTEAGAVLGSLQGRRALGSPWGVGVVALTILR